MSNNRISPKLSDGTRICVECGNKKDYTLEFPKTGAVCKVCVAEYKKQYRQDNAAEIARKNNERYEKNKEEILLANAIYRSSHKEEKALQDKKYREENRDDLLKQKRIYYEENKDEILAKNKIYYEENKAEILDQAKVYRQEKRKNDPSFKLKCYASNMIYKYLKNKGRSKGDLSCSKYFDYTFQQLKEHLEGQFEWWMTWENQGKYSRKTWDDNDPTTWTWNLDHIIPHSSFNYEKMGDKEFKRCWALDNLRPYSAKQNIIDGDRR